MANLICIVNLSLLYFYFSRTLLPSASSGQTIERLSLTQLFTSVIGIPISLYHLGTSSSQRFRGLPLGRPSSGWITSALLWGAVGAILLMFDHHLILFLLAVCFAGCMFTRRLISSFLILSILAFHAVFSETTHLCCCQHLPFFAGEGPVFTLAKQSWGEYRLYDMCLGDHADFFVPYYR